MHTLPNSNDTSSIRRRGFAGIKPDPIPVNYYGFDISSSIDAKYKLLILQNMPYRYFITFTFARYMNYQTSLEHISRLLRWANNKIFGRKYYKK